MAKSHTSGAAGKQVGAHVIGVASRAMGIRAMVSWLSLAGLFVCVTAESVPAIENAATLDLTHDRTSHRFAEPAFFVPPADCRPIAPRFIFLPPPSENADMVSYGTAVVARRLFDPPRLPQPLPAVTDRPDERFNTTPASRQHGPIILLPEPNDGLFTNGLLTAAPYPTETHGLP